MIDFETDFTVADSSVGLGVPASACFDLNEARCHFYEDRLRITALQSAVAAHSRGALAKLITADRTQLIHETIRQLCSMLFAEAWGSDVVCCCGGTGVPQFHYDWHSESAHQAPSASSINQSSS